MADKYLISSVVCDSKTSKKDVESFAVIYDFLKNQERKYIHSQKNLFMSGVSLIAVGIILFLLYPFLLFHFIRMALIFNIVSLSIAALGGVLLAIFFIRKPSLTTLQKIYFLYSHVTLMNLLQLVYQF